MSANIEVILKPLKLPIVGMGRIDIVCDNIVVSSGELGETVQVELPAGPHKIHLLLHGVFKRQSRSVNIDLEENTTTKFIAKYSRLWGTMKMKHCS